MTTIRVFLGMMIVIASISGGCGALIVPGYDYVLKKGSNHKIIAWTLEQNKQDDIHDGQLAILHRLRDADSPVIV